VLVLRHIAAPVANHCPAITKGGGECGAGSNECFDGYYRILPEARMIKTIAVICNFGRCFMQASADSVTGQVPDHLKAPHFRFGFYQVADVSNAHPAFYLVDGLLQDSF